MILLGIDVGTTGCKAAVFTPDGTLLAPRCDVIEDGMAMYGMETFPTIAPLFSASPSREVMIETGLSRTSRRLDAITRCIVGHCV